MQKLGRSKHQAQRKESDRNLTDGSDEEGTGTLPPHGLNICLQPDSRECE